MNDLTIIVLGAGASKSDGAPMQDELVRFFYETINQGDINNCSRDLICEYLKNSGIFIGLLIRQDYYLLLKSVLAY